MKLWHALSVQSSCHLTFCGVLILLIKEATFSLLNWVRVSSASEDNFKRPKIRLHVTLTGGHKEYKYMSANQNTSTKRGLPEAYGT